MRLFRVNRIINGQNEYLTVLACNGYQAGQVANDVKACREGTHKERTRWGCGI